MMNPGIPILDKIPLREMGLKIQSWLPSGSHHDFLEGIDASLLLFENTLINTANGATAEIAAGDGESFQDAMARAARQLCGHGQNSQRLLLLLPTADFVATSYNMNVGGEKLLRSALELQSHSLIPAYDENLLLAVNARSPEGVALWFNENEANRLFRAFEKQDLFLAAIMPRSLALHDAKSEEEKTVLINDEQGSNISVIQLKGNTIRKLLTVNRTDLEQDVFAKQWDIETSQLRGEDLRQMTSMHQWQELRCVVDAVPDYCFLPAGAIAEEKRISRTKKTKAAMAVAACIVLLLFTPFVSNWLTLRDLQREFERVQDMTEEPRSLQASIFDMEQEWGALYEYPDQQVAQVLISLNDVIQSSLTSFSINKGVIDITGSTNDPAYLVELLAEKEAFFNVGQNTVTRGAGAQFGIRMNLSSVDFEAYEEKYPLLNQGR